jgi:O-antigen/teichoic acid export membrane protein
MGIIGNIANYLDRLLLFHYLGAAEVAIYSIAIAPSEQLKGLFKNITTLAFPKYAEKHEKKSSDLFAGYGAKMWRFFLLASSIAVVYVVAAPYLYQIFFPKYLGAVVYSQIFALSLVTVISSIPVTILQAQAAKRKLYTLNTASSIGQIAFLFILIPYYGIMGAVIARLLSRGMTVIISLWLVRPEKQLSQ